MRLSANLDHLHQPGDIWKLQTIKDKVQTIGFLPPGLVVNSWHHLRVSQLVVQEEQIHNDLTNFLTSIQDTYIEGPNGSNARYPVPTWNVYGVSGEKEVQQLLCRKQLASDQL